MPCIGSLLLAGLPPPKILPIKAEDGCLTTDELKIASIHAKRLASTHTPLANPHFNEQWKAETEEWVSANLGLLQHLQQSGYFEEHDDVEFPITLLSNVSFQTRNCPKSSLQQFNVTTK
jgi:hypothetical protein